MKIIYLFLLSVFLFITACSTNKIQYDILEIDYGKLNQKVTENSKDAAAHNYLLALVKLEQGDIYSYFFYLSMAFMLYPTNEQIINKYIPVLYEFSKNDSTNNFNNFRQIIKLGNWAYKKKIKNHILFLYTAKSYEKLGKFKKAEKFYNLSLAAKKTNENLLAYFIFIYKYKKRIDNTLISKILKNIENDEITLLKVLYATAGLDVKVALKLGFKYYNIYDDKEMTNFILYCYEKLERNDKAFKLVVERLLKNKEVGESAFYSSFLMNEYKNKILPADSLYLICKNKYLKNYSLDALLHYFYLFVRINRLEYLKNCIDKYDEIIQKKITDENSYIKWNSLYLDYLARIGNHTELKNYIVENSKKDSLLSFSRAFFEVLSTESDSFKIKMDKTISKIEDKSIKNHFKFLYYCAVKDSLNALSTFEKEDKTIFKKSKYMIFYLTSLVLDITDDINKVYSIIKKKTTDSTDSPLYVMTNLLLLKNKVEIAKKFFFEKTKEEELKDISALETILQYIYDDPRYYRNLLTLFQKYEKKFSNNVSFLNDYGYFIADNEIEELYPKAEKLLLKALEMEKGDIMLMDSIGWLYFKMNKLKKANEYFSKINYDKVEYSEILYHFGMLYLKLNKIEKAKKAFEKILSLKDSDKYSSLAKQRLAEIGERNN